MIKIIKTICVCCVICGLTSCGDFTELDPKGKNLLTTCDQLEILLNVNYSKASSDMRVVSGDIISGFKNIANTINQNNKSRDAIMWTWDEKNQDIMANLTASDADFQNMYGYIGTICNPILQRVDDATGSPSIKKQLKAEALALRAWSHYILVNKFAKSFNPSTAVSTPGIIVMTENVDITVPQKQKTVEEVYNQIMSDIDEALKLDALPKTAVNRMRMSLPAVYALKALVCLNMQQWDDAEKAAKQALAIDGSLADFNSEYLVLTGNNQVINKPRAQFIEDYFYTNGSELYNAYLKEAWDYVENGHAHTAKMRNTIMTGSTMAKIYYGDPSLILTLDNNSGWNDSGLRIPQMYLAIAEAEIHKHNINAAMESLDKIRKCRIDSTIFEPLQGRVTKESDAIAHFKQTAHGENLYTIYNFIDRKRWNEIEGWSATYYRTLNGTVYSIKPNSSMWVFPFPLNELNNNPNLSQNYNK